MGNNQILPFERNRYYVGKLLTSADFQAEQNYGNNKRQFLNEMTFETAIIERYRRRESNLNQFFRVSRIPSFCSLDSSADMAERSTPR